MGLDTRKLCVICAWRANCTKRFSWGDDATMHCPDFTKDLTLRKVSQDETASEDEADS